MKKLIIVLTIICYNQISAQTDSPETTQHLFKGNLVLSPSLEYEFGITKNSIIGAQLGIELGSIENEVLDETRFVFYPVLDIYYRYYYNLKRRVRKEKNIRNNSGNYFGLTSYFSNADTLFDDINPDDSYLIAFGAVYGLQRTYFKRLNLGFEAGGAYGFSDIQESFVPILNFTLGWVFWSQSN